VQDEATKLSKIQKMVRHFQKYIKYTAFQSYKRVVITLKEHRRRLAKLKRCFRIFDGCQSKESLRECFDDWTLYSNENKKTQYRNSYLEMTAKIERLATLENELIKFEKEPKPHQEVLERIIQKKEKELLEKQHVLIRKVKKLSLEKLVRGLTNICYLSSFRALEHNSVKPYLLTTMRRREVRNVDSYEGLLNIPRKQDPKVREDFIKVQDESEPSCAGIQGKLSDSNAFDSPMFPYELESELEIENNRHTDPGFQEHSSFKVSEVCSGLIHGKHIWKIVRIQRFLRKKMLKKFLIRNGNYDEYMNTKAAPSMVKKVKLDITFSGNKSTCTIM